MFTLADNREIGRYFAELIGGIYKSEREFARKYLETEGLAADDYEVQKLANRLSQIKNGNKSVQLYDLPVFTKLLNISCEELLSAGRCFAASENRLTNHSVARTTDERIWKAYAGQPDAPMLRADEYGKTVIDYALACGNYELLKYLMENGYIWFVETDERKRAYRFGAGTSIRRLCDAPDRGDVLYSRMQEEALRLQMLLLAVRRNDAETLKALHAREEPYLYQCSALGCVTPDVPRDRFGGADDEPRVKEEKYFKKLLDAIAEADEKTLAYFAEEFEIKGIYGEVNRFLYPHLPELAARLLENGNKNGARLLLENAAVHNRNTYENLQKLMCGTIRAAQKLRPCWVGERERYDEAMTNRIMREFECSDGYVLYRDSGAKAGLVTNLFRMPEDVAADGGIGRLIAELNGWYDRVRGIRPDIERGTAE